MIELKDIRKSFPQGKNRVEVLKGINLKFRPGKWYTIYGASGSGKTTLLNVIGGLEEPDSGEVRFKENNIYRLKDQALSRFRNEKIGFVFQFFYLIADLSVKRNIELPASVSSKKVDGNWVEKLISVLKIEGLMNRNPLNLSGGEKQRVAMARALVNKPDFILADEPTGNLDEENSKKVIDLLTGLMRESGAGIILATHEKELMDRGDYKLQIKDGILYDRS